MNRDDEPKDPEEARRLHDRIADRYLSACGVFTVLSACLGGITAARVIMHATVGFDARRTFVSLLYGGLLLVSFVIAQSMWKSAKSHRRLADMRGSSREPEP